jgi:hypothetical protein
MKGENLQKYSHLSFLFSVFIFEPNTQWAPNYWGSDSAKQLREREEENSEGTYER